MKSLQERAKEFSNQLPFMAGREKGELDRIKNMAVTIRDFGFLTDVDKEGKEKEYVCFTVDEDPQNFYFGGQVITDNMKELDEEGYTEEIKQGGLPVEFGSKKANSSGRTYTTVTFYPESKETPKAGKK